MSRGARRSLVASYVLALLVPFLCIAVLSRGEIDTWLATGMCPAGPMDRPAAPCGVIDFVSLVFLGGWAAFIVVPTLVLWTLGCSVVWGGAAWWLSNRAQKSD